MGIVFGATVVAGILGRMLYGKATRKETHAASRIGKDTVQKDQGSSEPKKLQDKHSKS